jgi:hypothetical protein
MSTTAPGSQFPTSAAAIEELSTQLQHACPKQTGTLIIDHAGVVMAASGDCKEAADRLAPYLLTLMRDTNGIFVHSQQPNTKTKEELAKMTSASHDDRLQGGAASVACSPLADDLPVVCSVLFQFPSRPISTRSR